MIPRVLRTGSPLRVSATLYLQDYGWLSQNRLVYNSKSMVREMTASDQLFPPEESIFLKYASFLAESRLLVIYCQGAVPIKRLTMRRP